MKKTSTPHTPTTDALTQIISAPVAVLFAVIALSIAIPLSGLAWIEHGVRRFFRLDVSEKSGVD